MPVHWENSKGKCLKMHRLEMSDVNEITADFASLKFSILRKASRISAEVDRVTIGPQSVINTDDSDKLDDIENEQNACNVESPKKINTSVKQNTVLTQNGISFSIKKIFHESELQRKDKVGKEMQHHVRQMRENERAIQEQGMKKRWLMMHEREHRSAENLAFFLAEEERKAEQEEVQRREALELQAQRAREQKEKLEREMEEQRRTKEREEMKDAITMRQNKFAEIYCDIGALLQRYQDKQVLQKEHKLKIKTLIEQIYKIDIVMQLTIKDETKLSTNVDSFNKLISDFDEMLHVMRVEIDKISLECETGLTDDDNVQTEDEEEEPIEETENNQIQNVESIQQSDENSIARNKEENAESEPSVNRELEVASSVICAPELPVCEAKSTEASAESKDSHVSVYQGLFEIYFGTLQFLKNYKESYSGYFQSQDAKKFRFECQKAINIPVNAISGINTQHLQDKYDRLHNLLTGKSSLKIEQYPGGDKFCKEHLAKKMVGQGETLVSCKPEMAFPIAAIIVALWNEHMDFGNLFLAHLYKACPFTTPFFRPRKVNESNEDYYKDLGCKYSEDGALEDQDKFLRRMSGIMRLYASIMVTRQRKGVMKRHPHDLKYAWEWLAVILNTEPETDVVLLCTTLILDMLEIAGNMLWTVYPTQFPKLLRLLMEQYYPRMLNLGVVGGPLVRLEEFLRNALQQNTIPSPKGLLSPDFW